MLTNVFDFFQVEDFKISKLVHRQLLKNIFKLALPTLNLLALTKCSLPLLTIFSLGLPC